MSDNDVYGPAATGLGQRVVVLPRDVVDEAVTRPITSGLLPTDVGYFPSIGGHYVARPDGAPEAILKYCVRGRGWVEMYGRQHVVERDTVFVVPARCPHIYGAARQNPWTIYWCHLTGRQVPSLLRLLDVDASRPTFRIDDPTQVVPLFESILATLEAGHSWSALTRASLAAGHLIGTLAASAGSGPMVDVQARLDRAIEFMHESAVGRSAAVPVAEIAAIANLSPSHFSAVFKRRTGRSVLAYFIELKMTEASRRLRTTAAAVKDVAADLGYDDALYFSRLFRRFVGSSPRQFRTGDRPEYFRPAIG